MRFVDTTPLDAQEFIDRVETIVTRATDARPDSVYLVRIDGWFGERWLGFAGKVEGAAGVHLRTNLTLPPFKPSRVIRQICYRFAPQERAYVREECTFPLHIDQPSSANLRRSVDALLPTAALVWFSDHSERDRRGSVMAYVPAETAHVGWYADFAADGAWRAKRVIGLTRRELEAS